MKTIIVLSIYHFSFLIFHCFAQQPGWEIIPSGTTEELNSIFFYDYEVGFACGNSGTVLKSIDSGKTWQSFNPPATFDLNDLYMFHRDTIMVVGDSGAIFFSDTGGLGWMGNIYMEEDILSVSFADGQGICGCISQTILHCEYTGTSLTCMTVQTGFFGGGFWGAYMLSPQFGFVAGENTIFQPLLGRSTDSGFNWNFNSFYLNGNEGRATGVDFTDLNTGYLSARVWDGTGAIAKTTDGGSNWISTMFSNPLWSVDFPISGASLVGFAVGSQGTILKTYDAGANWQQQNSGTSLRLNKVFFKDFDFGFAVGENGLILRTTTGGEPTTFVENENQAPLSFQLYQNYPNPFNPSTKIKFTIPPTPLSFGDLPDGKAGGQGVRLIVYDVLGNEIATLVNEELPAGEYEVEFLPESLKGAGSIKQLASGIYFYQLQVSSFIQTKKMVYLK